jgi:hypothetical protein
MAFTLHASCREHSRDEIRPSNCDKAQQLLHQSSVVFKNSQSFLLLCSVSTAFLVLLHRQSVGNNKEATESTVCY